MWFKKRKGFSAFLTALMLVFAELASLAPSLHAEAATLSYNWAMRDDYNSSISAQAEAYYTGEYSYDNLANLSGTDLFNAVHALMKDTMTASVTYNSLPSYWDYTDAEGGDAGTVLFYSNVDKSKVSTQLNREHVWPKSNASFFEIGGGADLHHLRPADSNINSTRGNLLMGNVSDRDSHAVYFTGMSPQNLAGYVGDNKYEPRDNVKGDVARIFLYVYTRWQQPNLFEAGRNPNFDDDDSANGGSPVIESLATLLEWNYEDPVDEWEVVRNDLTQDVQGNRNVFIDYPELAWKLFGIEVPEGLVSPSSESKELSEFDRDSVAGYTVPEMTFDEATHRPVINLSKYKVDDGEYILYNENYGKALSSDAVNNYYRAGVDYTPGTEAPATIKWTLSRRADGTFNITSSQGNKLSVSSSQKNLMLDNTDPQAIFYSDWYLKSDGAGNFVVESGKKANQYVYWGTNYNDFSTGDYTGNMQDFSFKLINANGENVVGSELTPDDIGTIVNKDRKNVDVENGEYVLYNNACKVAMSSTTMLDYYRAGVSYTLNADGTVPSPKDTELWTVTKNDNGTYSIATKDGKLLGMADDGHSSTGFDMVFNEWQFVEGDKAGTVVIKNVGRNAYTWYENSAGRFKASELSDDNIGVFEISLLKAGEGTIPPVPPKPVLVDNAFNQITAVDQIVDGKYILATKVGDNLIALDKDLPQVEKPGKNTRGGKVVTLEDGVIKEAEASVVWTLTNTENGITLQDSEGKYLAMSNNANTPYSANTNQDTLDQYCYYTVSVNEKAENAFFVTTTNAENGRAISAYLTNGEFANYRGYVPSKGNCQPLFLYKFEEKTYDIPDGEYAIYNSEAKGLLSSNAVATYYRAIVAADLNEDGTVSNAKETELWTVKNNEDGTITLTNADHTLSASTGRSNLTLDEENNKWEVTKNDDGTFYLKNAATGNFVEYYASKKEFSTYKFNDKSPEIYKLKFVKNKVEEVPPVPPTPVEGGDYKKVVSLDELTEGNYLIVVSDDTKTYAMKKDNGDLNKNVRDKAEVTLADDVIKTEDSSIIWKLTKTDKGFTLQDEEGGFLSMGNKNNKCYSAGNPAEANDNSYFTIDLAEDGAATIENADNTRSISPYINKGELVDFRGYVKTSNSFKPVYLYKEVKEVVVEKNIVEDGTYVVYNSGAMMALSASETGKFYRKGIEAIVADGKVLGTGAKEIWTVTNFEDEEGNKLVKISNYGRNLSVSDKKNNATISESADSWILEANEDGSVYVKNASTNGYLEWYAKYNEFSTYTKISEGQEDLFKMTFVPVDTYNCEENGHVAVYNGEKAVCLVCGEDLGAYTGFINNASNELTVYLEEGVLKTGIVTIDGNEYLFEEDGTLSTAKEYVVECEVGKLVYTLKNGVVTGKNGFEKVSSDPATYKYYVNSEFVTGWQEIDGATYYFKNDGSMATSDITIGGIRYKIGADGKHTEGTFARYILFGTRYYFAGS
ncbi:MAG: endonuclease [Lachnospiraceae bacterium]|nr:endonuclease [Lachnospiraceae bacterium]